MANDRSYYSSTRPEMQALLPPAPRRVLEIGCGEGRFSQSIVGAEERWGVEPEPVSAAAATPRLTRVLHGLYDTQRDNLPDGYFDLVVCNDVIEHMTDHDGFLRDIRRKMAPGGHIVGSVPNIRNYKALFELLVLRDWHYRNDGVLDRTHHRFFTLRSLRQSLEGAGYRVERLHGINPDLRMPRSAHAAAYALFGWGLIAASLGHARDVRFLQLGFRTAV